MTEGGLDFYGRPPSIQPGSGWGRRVPSLPPVPFRSEIGTPGGPGATRVMLLGSGELGREVAIELVRLGAEVIAVDRYAHAPAMAVAHRSHVVAMTDGQALRELVRRVRPHLLVPEIEQVDTAELERLESEGTPVIPRAAATRATMDRERIRRLASETAGVPTSRFAFVQSAEEARAAAGAIGFPCLFKAMMSSSGHGMTVVRGPGEVDAAYRSATKEGRVASSRAMVEEWVPFDLEVTMLTLRHYGPDGRLRTTVLAPVGHARPGTLYHESWQPADLPAPVVERLGEVAARVTDELGGLGLYGVECFVAGDRVLFSEVSPRPHDTGLVTLASQWNSEFALHARAILGLPYEGPEPVVPSAAHVVLSPAAGPHPAFGGLAEALHRSGVRLHLFGKPDGYPERRLGVAVARAANVTLARKRAEESAHAVERTIGFPAGAPAAGGGELPR